MKTKRIVTKINISPELYEKCKIRIKKLGLIWPEYIEFLVKNDINKSKNKLMKDGDSSQMGVSKYGASYSATVQ